MPKHRHRIATQLRTARRSLTDLNRALHRLTQSVRGLGKNTAARALKLQGQYMGYMRMLKPKQKAEVRALREKKGMRPAIARAKHLAGS